MSQNQQQATKLPKEPKWNPKHFSGSTIEWIAWRTSIDNWMDNWGFPQHISSTQQQAVTRSTADKTRLIDNKLKSLIMSTLTGTAETDMLIWLAEQRVANQSPGAAEYLQHLEDTYFTNNAPTC
jgi:hypothetical protein